MTVSSAAARVSLRRHAIWGLVSLVVLFGGVGGWAVTTELSGAVVAPGLLVVDSNVKKVQHPTGGVIGELHVRDGDRVRAGDVVVRLDETVARANLAIVVNGFDEALGREARLEAERDGRDTIAYSTELAARSSEVRVAKIVESETKLFEFRKVARRGQTAQLNERIAQLQEEILGLAGQSEARRREIDLIHRELEGVRELWAKNLIPISRVTALEREAVRLEGERNQLAASAAQTRGRIAEIRLQIIQIDQELRSEASKELREIQAKKAELAERRVAAEDQLKRSEIRSPQDGVVHQLAVHTIGGVVGASEPLMLIVPAADELIVEVRVAPQDIDQLRHGQPAVLRFAAFNQRTTPEIGGSVSRISADITQDPRSGAAYYVARVAIPATEIARLGSLKLVPGMPVETFIQTGSRTVVSYLLKPLSDQIAKAFRER